MNFKELLEGAEPKMPGAPSGISIMTPQQFVAKAGDSKPEEEINEFAPYDHNDSDDDFDDEGDDELRSLYDTKFELEAELDYADEEDREHLESELEDVHARILELKPDAILEQGLAEGMRKWLVIHSGSRGEGGKMIIKAPDFDTAWKLANEYDLDIIEVKPVKGVAEGAEEDMSKEAKAMATGKCPHCHGPVQKKEHPTLTQYHCAKCGIRASVDKQGVAESQEHLDRIRKLSGLDEATKLPASSREFGGQEFQDYMNRIVGTPDKDKAGNVKIDKKGNEKYTTGKTKTDKYKMPYIHRSSVVTYLSPDGKTYDEDAVKQTLAQRPKALLKQNEKMKHSNGELEQFFNVGFAALTGIALDQDTNKLIIVNTCPGAGSCKVDCFAMKGGKIQFKAAWQSDGRILTYLLNDPDGFFSQLSGEISKEAALGKKGGYTVTIRWHDAGDFFSPEYLDMALKMAAKHPDVKFYAYTKMAGAALAAKPDNFIINWSEGAHTSQEKQVKASDANLDTTKNSRIVPDELFQDLLIKDEKGNLVKGESGQWQVQPNKLSDLKQRLAKQYGLSANSILSYDEYIAKRKSIPAGMKYNVIVAPGEGDISANDPNIISTLLLRH